MVFNQTIIIKDLVAICQAIDPDLFKDWLLTLAVAILLLDLCQLRHLA